ncbi:transmembrane Fragile-X-F protein [Rummeliibacillus pycnus]|uniref:transmembrane Fragile-X-F protein n=1 Tax=Rummeliibacillus pycnus TaxID=101070 RepID=UPI003D285A60
MGFAESLTIILIILKLVGIISWSWWFVLLPEIFAVCVYIIVWIVWLFYSVKQNKQERKL